MAPVGLALAGVGEAAVVERIGIVRIEPDRLVQIRDRAVRLVL